MALGHNAVCTCGDCEAERQRASTSGVAGFGLSVEWNDAPPVIHGPEAAVTAAELALEAAQEKVILAHVAVEESHNAVVAATVALDDARKRAKDFNIAAAQRALDSASAKGKKKA